MDTQLQMPAWEGFALQMTLLRVAGATLVDILDALHDQGFSKEPPFVQLKSLQSAGFTLEEVLPVASRLSWRLPEILESLHGGGAESLQFKPVDLEYLCRLPASRGISAEDRLRFSLSCTENARFRIHLAMLLCRLDPSPILANLLREAGIDPNSLLLHAHSAVQAEILKTQLGLSRWGGLGIPDWLWMGDSVPTFRKRKVPPTNLAILAPGDLTFESCHFAPVAPPIQANCLLIQSCPTLRRLEFLDVHDLALVDNPKLERLPTGLNLPGSLAIKGCPRLWLPQGLTIGGDLFIDGLGTHGGLPESLVVRGEMQITHAHSVVSSA